MSEQPQSPPRQRRPSLVDFFSPRANSSSAVSSSPPSGVPPSPVAPQHRRGISISGLGLAGGSQGPSSPYTAFARQRRASVAASSASSSPEFKNSFGDEPVVIEEDDTVKPPSNNQSGHFGRRLSFGAQALRDVKQGNSPGSPGAGEGFNWSEALRDRTKRSPSFSSSGPFASTSSRPRAQSIVVVEPPKEMPKPVEPLPMRMKKPDHLGERMLRGDFMMD